MNRMVGKAKRAHHDQDFYPLRETDFGMFKNKKPGQAIHRGANPSMPCCLPGLSFGAHASLQDVSIVLYELAIANT